MEYFDRLMSRLEEGWHACNYSEADFPRLATDVLNDAPAHASVDPLDVARWAASSPTIPVQFVDHTFEGMFGVTVRSGKGFMVDVYTWFEASTAIHQHAFSGAFQVLSGSSLHSLHGFEVERKVNSRFLLGNVKLRRSELLRKGDVHTILPGNDGAHSLYHLDEPSVTVTVRTVSQPDAKPQLNYHPPHVASDPQYLPQERVVRREALAALQRSDERVYYADLTALIEGADLEELYWLLEQHVRRNADRLDERFEALLRAAPPRFGDYVPMFRATLEHAVRQHHLISLRRRVRRPEHRFYLAVLLNAENRLQALDYVRHAFPDRDPAAATMAWTEELLSSPVDGEAGTALELELEPDAMRVLRLVIEGYRGDDLLGEYSRRFGCAAEIVDRQRGQIFELIEALKSSSVFHVLAAGS